MDLGKITKILREKQNPFGTLPGDYAHTLSHSGNELKNNYIEMEAFIDEARQQSRNASLLANVGFGKTHFSQHFSLYKIPNQNLTLHENQIFTAYIGIDEVINHIRTKIQKESIDFVKEIWTQVIAIALDENDEKRSIFASLKTSGIPPELIKWLMNFKKQEIAAVDEKSHAILKEIKNKERALEEATLKKVSKEVRKHDELVLETLKENLARPKLDLDTWIKILDTVTREIFTRVNHARVILFIDEVERLTKFQDTKANFSSASILKEILEACSGFASKTQWKLNYVSLMIACTFSAYTGLIRYENSIGDRINHPITLGNFDFEDLKEAIIDRLKTIIGDDNYSEIFPFSPEVVSWISKVSLGKPRTAFNLCHTLYSDFLTENEEIIAAGNIITLSFARSKYQEKYLDTFRVNDIKKKLEGEINQLNKDSAYNSGDRARMIIEFLIAETDRNVIQVETLKKKLLEILIFENITDLVLNYLQNLEILKTLRLDDLYFKIDLKNLSPLDGLEHNDRFVLDIIYAQFPEMFSKEDLIAALKEVNADEKIIAELDSSLKFLVDTNQIYQDPSGNYHRSKPTDKWSIFRSMQITVRGILGNLRTASRKERYIESTKYFIPHFLKRKFTQDITLEQIPNFNNLFLIRVKFEEKSRFIKTDFKILLYITAEIGPNNNQTEPLRLEDLRTIVEYLENVADSDVLLLLVFGRYSPAILLPNNEGVITLDQLKSNTIKTEFINQNFPSLSFLTQKTQKYGNLRIPIFQHERILFFNFDANDLINDKNYNDHQLILSITDVIIGFQTLYEKLAPALEDDSLSNEILDKFSASFGAMCDVDNVLFKNDYPYGIISRLHSIPQGLNNRIKEFIVEIIQSPKQEKIINQIELTNEFKGQLEDTGLVEIKQISGILNEFKVILKKGKGPMRLTLAEQLIFEQGLSYQDKRTLVQIFEQIKTTTYGNGTSPFTITCVPLNFGGTVIIRERRDALKNLILILEKKLGGGIEIEPKDGTRDLYRKLNIIITPKNIEQLISEIKGIILNLHKEGYDRRILPNLSEYFKEWDGEDKNAGENATYDLQIVNNVDDEQKDRSLNELYNDLLKKKTQLEDIFKEIKDNIESKEKQLKTEREKLSSNTLHMDLYNLSKEKVIEIIEKNLEFGAIYEQILGKNPIPNIADEWNAHEDEDIYTQNLSALLDSLELPNTKKYLMWKIIENIFLSPELNDFETSIQEYQRLNQIFWNTTNTTTLSQLEADLDQKIVTGNSIGEFLNQFIEDLSVFTKKWVDCIKNNSFLGSNIDIENILNSLLNSQIITEADKKDLIGKIHLLMEQGELNRLLEIVESKEELEPEGLRFTFFSQLISGHFSLGGVLSFIKINLINFIGKSFVADKIAQFRTFKEKIVKEWPKLKKVLPEIQEPNLSITELASQILEHKETNVIQKLSSDFKEKITKEINDLYDQIRNKIVASSIGIEKSILQSIGAKDFSSIINNCFNKGFDDLSADGLKEFLKIVLKLESIGFKLLGQN